MARIAVSIASLAAFLALACSGGACSKTDAPAGAPAADATPVAGPAKPAESLGPSAQGGAPGRVRGVVRLSGPAPKPVLYTVTEASCEAHHKTVPSEDIVLGDGNALANVLVHVREAPPAAAPPAGPVHLDQRGCVYLPHVVAIQLGQKVVTKNSDQALHNVHTYPKRSSAQNRAMPPGSADLELAFAQPELGVRVGCDVHPWMKAVVHVLKHPHFDLSDAAGAFDLPGVPPGRYTIEAVHETLGTRTQVLEVAPGADLPIEISFAAK